MQFEVWHRIAPTFMNNDTQDLARTFPDGFTKVAVVDTPYVGQVFQLTNHIDRAWQENPEVLEAVRPARSTSVGDVIVLRGESGLPQVGAPKIQTAWTIDGHGLRTWL